MRKQIEDKIESSDSIPLRVYIEWGEYDLRSPDEVWDSRASIRSLAEYLRKRGHDVIGGEVHDGTGWSSWRNRTDVMLEALFPLN
ncbi:MAG: hypothetical protein IH899_22195 [Planctomycetes bacterium]|nr:hypothetical protein [Planctomycetota bacterium]